MNPPVAAFAKILPPHRGLRRSSSGKGLSFGRGGSRKWSEGKGGWSGTAQNRSQTAQKTNLVIDEILLSFLRSWVKSYLDF